MPVRTGRIRENSVSPWKEEDGQLGARNHTWQQGDREHSTEVLCEEKTPTACQGNNWGLHTSAAPRERAVLLQDCQEQAQRAAGCGVSRLPRARRLQPLQPSPVTTSRATAPAPKSNSSEQGGAGPCKGRPVTPRY